MAALQFRAAGVHQWLSAVVSTVLLNLYVTLAVMSGAIGANGVT